MSKASVQDTIKAINEACKSKGGAFAQYSCKSVSWDDAQRGTVGGNLSCWGSNITDTRLYEKSGQQLFTVRPDNWDEKLGRVSTGDVALLVGNEARRGTELRPMTLRNYLKTIGQHASYAGLKEGQSLHEDMLDQQVSIRFQTTFLPVEEDGSNRETLEFAPEAYNYNTQDDADPRNLVLLCTTQGTAVQQDGKGAKKLYHHAVDEEGLVHRYWLEAEASNHKVGGAQKESAEEKADALARGKATASVIGVKAMGTRFNVLMTIQCPLKQKPKPQHRDKPMMKMSTHKKTKGLQMECSSSDEGSWGSEDDIYTWATNSACELQCGGSLFFCGGAIESHCADLMMDMCSAAPPSVGAAPTRRSRSLRSAVAERAAPRKGKATAARVSRGSEVDIWKGLTVQGPQRNEAEHITVTVVIYNTVAGGVPSEGDVAAAVTDMEALYRQCEWSGRLADEGADFMKAELTVADAAKIGNKIATQPYKPPSQGVVGCDMFPVDEEEEEEEEPAVHSNVICDVSEKKIVGVRYHKKGEDYDLCEAEFRKLCAAEQVLYEMICRPGAEPVDLLMTMSA